MGLVIASIGDIQIYLYGLMVVAAVLLGMLAVWLNTRLQGESFAPVWDFLLWGLPLGLAAARLVYVGRHWELYAKQPGDILCLWQGGISFYGGMAGFLLAMLFCCYWKGLDIWYWLDLMVPGIILGTAVNELGNFVTQMTVGMPFPANLPNDHTLAEYIEFRYRPSGFENYEYFHPVALYQMGLQLLVLLLSAGLSLWQMRTGRFRKGCIFLLAVLCMALIRFGCGFFYLSTQAPLTIHIGQWIALLLAATALVLFLWRMHGRRTGLSYRY